MKLPAVPADRDGALAWVARHLDGLYSGPVEASPRFRGGATEAHDALAAFDVGGYARRRNEVLPEERRGASELSPYIRHGLLQLRAVWDHVAGGPSGDVAKFRDELLWQEYARHLYARLGRRTAASLRFTVGQPRPQPPPSGMACLEFVTESLETDGWLVNQTRMWMASQWAVRQGDDWREGEDWFFRHLLDGSRAANRLGWQWTVGTATGKSYGFSRHQVERRAPQLCAGCPHRAACPIETWPPSASIERIEADGEIARARSDVAGPAQVVRDRRADAVWLTAESLGDADPALAANPTLPAVFVFDEPLLHTLQLSAKRLVFLAESLGDLATRREVEVYRGRPADVLGSRAPAVTYAPVPGFQRRAAAVDAAEIHPWPWLVAPHDRSVASFSAWRKNVRLPG